MKITKNKLFQAAALLVLTAGTALASTSGGQVFAPISQGLTSVMTGLEDLGGFIIAGGVVLGGYAVVKGAGEHKGSMMTGIGAIIGGIAASNASQIASAVSGAATIGHSSVFSLVLAHLPALV